MKTIPPMRYQFGQRQASIMAKADQAIHRAVESARRAKELQQSTQQRLIELDRRLALLAVELAALGDEL